MSYFSTFIKYIHVLTLVAFLFFSYPLLFRGQR
uniref:Uncharacterized protein n=1 Tax=Arundo donax TaxID=35708 RepID=A0A0A8YKA3_ARUDO